MRTRVLIILTVAAALMAAAAVAAPKGKKKARSPRKAKTEKIVEKKPERRALVNVAAACLRTQPSHASQLETQASYGTPVSILDQQGEWYRIEIPDGYKAWIIGSSIVEKTQEEINAWRQAQRLVVTRPQQASAWNDSINTTDGNVAFDIVLGSIFEGAKKPGTRYAELTLPDGRRGYAMASDVADFAEWSRQTPSVDTVLDNARAFMGVTYLWGGATPKAMDCSGLTKLCYGAAGLILPRNASDQARIGQTLDPAQPETFRRGDLLFFGTGDGTVVTHVGIYDGFTRYIHASGRVYESSFNPSHPLYIPRKVIGACRIIGADSQKGITPYAEHPMYFNQSK